MMLDQPRKVGKAACHPHSSVEITSVRCTVVFQEEVLGKLRVEIAPALLEDMSIRKMEIVGQKVSIVHSVVKQIVNFCRSALVIDRYRNISLFTVADERITFCDDILK